MKRAGERCENLTADGECGVYADRPQACRDFECGWRMDPRFREDERPNQVGVLVMGMHLGKARLNVLHELRPGAIGAYHGERLLRRVAKRALVGIAEHGKPPTFSNLRLAGPQRLLNGLISTVRQAIGR